MVTTKRLSIVPTLRCTLKCKLCSNHMPEFKKPYDVSYEEMTKDIASIFELFDYIEWLQFVGGEIFLVKYMADVYEYCYKYYADADLVISSRYHMVTPCNAMGIPCIFVNRNINYYKKDIRLDTLNPTIQFCDIENVKNIDWNPSWIEFNDLKKKMLELAEIRIKDAVLRYSSEVL